MTGRRQTMPPAAPPLRASGDRWLFGYADVVTLLFASFAALYATQIGHRAPADPGSPDPPAIAQPASSTRLAGALTAVVAGAERLGVDLVARPGRLTISVTEAGSFAPGRADLTPEAERVIRRLADALRAQPHEVRVEGHTDDRPIRTPLFASNWELSTARATRVVQFLIEACGIAPGRLSAAGFAEHRPRVANGTAEDRARNRRVDIVVLAGES
jgi:chemotaxis protein MotB